MYLHGLNNRRVTPRYSGNSKTAAVNNTAGSMITFNIKTLISTLVASRVYLSPVQHVNFVVRLVGLWPVYQFLKIKEVYSLQTSSSDVKRCVVRLHCACIFRVAFNIGLHNPTRLRFFNRRVTQRERHSSSVCQVVRQCLVNFLQNKTTFIRSFLFAIIQYHKFSRLTQSFLHYTTLDLSHQAERAI